MIADYIARSCLWTFPPPKPSHTYIFPMSHSPPENDVYKLSHEKLLKMRPLLDKDLDAQMAEMWVRSFSEELVHHYSIKGSYH